jgi:hypothetical protein
MKYRLDNREFITGKRQRIHSSCLEDNADYFASNKTIMGKIDK